jgi:hypothetical protein
LLKAKIGEEKQLQAILRKNSLNCGGKLLFLDQPKVMGILNTTPDSFYEQSRVGNSQLLIDRAGKMLEDGAAILDIGGQSTRPGAEIVGVEEELTRLLPAIQLLKSTFPDAILSVALARLWSMMFLAGKILPCFKQFQIYKCHMY